MRAEARCVGKGLEAEMVHHELPEMWSAVTIVMLVSVVSPSTEPVSRQVDARFHTKKYFLLATVCPGRCHALAAWWVAVVW